MDYIVRNPVTREFRSLPRPHKAYRHVAVAFICKGSNATPLDGIEYEVIRAGILQPWKLTRTLEIDTFSSVTNRWTAASLESSSPFALLVANRPAVVVGEVIYWGGMSSTVLAYDCAMETVQLIKLPRVTLETGDFLLGQSEGQLQHGRFDLDGLEIWVLEDYRRSEWILKHRVSFTEVNHLARSPGWLAPLWLHGFHSNKSELLFITWSGHPFWIDFKNYTLTETGGGLIMG
ncbi:F-box protein At5g03970 [Coffea arabica]|uniref:F-box protein At5g03970 n=1 Tax=Coffea arabica TaxID=13443 RepID=A0ABM4UF62_COFAR